MVSGAISGARTQTSDIPSQSAKFSNFSVTVDGVTERIGEENFALEVPESQPNSGGGFQGMGRSRGVTFFQTEYQGKPVEYLAESTLMPRFRTEKQLKGKVK